MKWWSWYFDLVAVVIFNSGCGIAMWSYCEVMVVCACKRMCLHVHMCVYVCAHVQVYG